MINKLHWKSNIKSFFLENSLAVTLLITILFFAIMTFIAYPSISKAVSNLFIYLCLSLIFVLLSLLRNPSHKAIKMIIVFCFLSVPIIMINNFKFMTLQHLELGQNFLKIGKKDLAIKEMESTLKHPGYLEKNTICDIHFNLIWLYLDSQQWDNAYREASRLWILDRDNHIIKLDSDPRGFFYYAFCYGKKNMIKEAIERYLNVLSQYPTNHAVHYQLSKLYHLNREPEKAIYHCTEAIRLFPKYTDYHYFLGGLYVSKDDFSSAIEEYKLTLALEPFHKNALLSLCNLLTASFPNQEDALRFSRILAGKYPYDASSHQLLARAYGMNSSYEDAIREYKRAIRLEPKDAGLRREFARFLVDISIRKIELKSNRNPSLLTSLKNLCKNFLILLTNKG